MRRASRWMASQEGRPAEAAGAEARRAGAREQERVKVRRTHRRVRPALARLRGSDSELRGFGRHSRPHLGAEGNAAARAGAGTEHGAAGAVTPVAGRLCLQGRVWEKPPQARGPPSPGHSCTRKGDAAAPHRGPTALQPHDFAPWCPLAAKDSVPERLPGWDTDGS